ncbi:unnamed protein product, partial [Symbiodinium necroappetens]
TNRPRGRDIILLSAFDGIGAAPYIVDRDFGRPRLAVSWEVDRACKALVQQAMPWIEHRGDLSRDSPKNVADLVLEADPNAEAMVLWCAAPPCQDFSRIAQGAGHQGEHGRLFEDSVAFMDELRSALRQHRFAFLYENVEMDAEAAKVSSDALGVSPVFVCPSDACAWQPPGRRRRTVGGRGRQFAPWHNTVEAMLQDSRGVLHIPPPDVKEQLHHIPAGYTATAGADTKTRHHGWHWGVAARLLGILVMATWAKPVWSRRGWDFSPPPRPTLALLGAGLSSSSAGSGAMTSSASAPRCSGSSRRWSTTPRRIRSPGWALWTSLRPAAPGLGYPAGSCAPTSVTLAPKGWTGCAGRTPNTWP